MINKFAVLGQEIGKTIPEWVRILPLGKMTFSDGLAMGDADHLNITAASVAQVVAAWQKRGLDLVVDYEHQTLFLDKGKAPAAGWIKELVARADGLWARIEWTAVAKQHIQAGEYRFYSPVMTYDPDTLEPRKLLHLSLTNTPAIDNLQPLAAKMAALTGGNDPKAAQVARAKQYGIGVKDDGNVTKPGKWAEVPDAQWGDPVNYGYPMPDEAHAGNALARWNDPSNQAPYSEAERAVIMKRIMARHKELGMPTDGGKKAMKTKLLGLPGLQALKAEAGDDEIIAALAARLQQADALPKLATALGLEKPEQATPSQIEGAILALKQGSEQLTSLSAKLAKLETENAQGKAQKAVDEALAARKITPAQSVWALGYAQRDLEGFQAFVAAAVPILAAKHLEIPADDKKPGGVLDEGELAVCKQMGLSPENYLASKQQLAAV